MNANGKKVVIIPRQGEWYTVDPMLIDRELFLKERENHLEEIGRQWVKEALCTMDHNQEKYCKCFETLIPIIHVCGLTVGRYKVMAEELGGNLSDWVFEGLEIGQRISRESWYDVCCARDINKWHRMIEWRNGLVTTIGGSEIFPASSIKNYEDDLPDNRAIGATIPKVVRYKPCIGKN